MTMELLLPIWADVAGEENEETTFALWIYIMDVRCLRIRLPTHICGDTHDHEENKFHQKRSRLFQLSRSTVRVLYSVRDYGIFQRHSQDQI